MKSKNWETYINRQANLPISFTPHELHAIVLKIERNYPDILLSGITDRAIFKFFAGVSDCRKLTQKTKLELVKVLQSRGWELSRPEWIWKKLSK